MAQKKADKELSTAQKVGLGLGLTAAAVAAAGGYFLYGSKSAEKNRKKVKSWTLKAKGEVLEALEKAEMISEAEYKALVAAASGAYGSVQKATKGEMKDFAEEMQTHWQKLQKSGTLKKVASVMKAAPKAAAKKAAPKAAAPAKKAAPKKAAPKKVA